ncbi:helix-turn-helix domain-containing protein [Klebsiella pneumoniae]|nr:helix-turn-helix domain-containing protein [Klebsiella pneumoniae]MBD1070601.1 helix-turn-helix domain-containing protein [Klebsiella pneumoniae]MBD1075064.1 helix-turn-helix domain-containing protein [Klebsiella pneumoniae]MBD1086206.1 helix-turn-helix domain-containing protein [Klebsiella pneumoniae]MBD1114382.1 helix-turn-helix domain-containing protein [Klebsiella pneumoniae]
MGSCAAPSAKGDDKFITTDYLQQCRISAIAREFNTTRQTILRVKAGLLQE